MEIKIGDLKVGNIDAKNEILNLETTTGDGKDSFIKSFYTIDQMFIESFISGQSYFITGLKGSGKTSILRYIDAIVSKDENSVEYILFKSNIKEEDREHFSKNSISIISDGDFPIQSDYESIVNIFFHRIICAVATKKNLYKDNESFKKYQKLLTIEGESVLTAIKRLLPKLTKGSIKLAAGSDFVSGEFGLEFEGRGVSEASVPISILAERVNDVFTTLEPAIGKKIYILVDELETAFRNTNQYIRDCNIIRDFIVEIERINSISREHDLNIAIIACLRTEVIRSIDTSGKEINKAIFDFGHEITWHDKGRDSQHPLISLLCTKIRAAYSLLEPRSKYAALPDDKIISELFPPTILDVDIAQYLLSNSWYRPRDIIRMIMLIQRKYPSHTKFQKTGFEEVRKKYSQDSWTEITEELLASYSKGAMKGLLTILRGFKPYFSQADFSHRCTSKSYADANVKELLKKHSSDDILYDLYRVGVIGNDIPKLGKKRFVFRGDDELIIEEQMMIHFALRRGLDIF